MTKKNNILLLDYFCARKKMNKGNPQNNMVTVFVSECWSGILYRKESLREEEEEEEREEEEEDDDGDDNYRLFIVPHLVRAQGVTNT